MTSPQRVDVLGSRISACNREQLAAVLRDAWQRRQGGYVCFTNVHTVVEGCRDPYFRDVTNGSLLSLPDGKPVHWVAQAKHRGSTTHLPGPDTMLELIEQFPEQGHFFYGSRPETLERLQRALRERVPSLRICGAISPPFRPQSAEEIDSDLQAMRDSQAAFVWIGLGAPRQELWMAAHSARVPSAVMFGVGAAFDFHAGTTPRAPGLMRRLGLEWLYRLAREPRRLWRRYATTNSLFVWYLLRGVPQGSSQRSAR